jgi:3',5'-cyclic-AMP phosphodiesterase
MPAFLHITDTHIVAKGALACGHSDTAAALVRTVASVRARLADLGSIDCAVITGDLTDQGTAGEYAHFAELMEGFPLPWMAVPGNHDNREAMRTAFTGAPWLPKSGPIQWLHDFGPFVMIGLDTVLEGAHHGWLSDEGHDFLDGALSRNAHRPVVVATHHPWMHSGIDAMDKDNLRNGSALMERLQRHPFPVTMISGHVHRAMSCHMGSVACHIGPSTAHAVHADLRPGAVNALTLEPGAVTLFRWHDEPQACLVSNILPNAAFAGPWPFE